MSDPLIKVQSARGLLTRKLIVAFLVSGGAYLIPESLHILDALRAGDQSVDLTGAVFVSLAAGTFGAALRGIIAYLPGSPGGPTDALHTLGKGDKPSTIVVDENPAGVSVQVVDELEA